MLSTEDNIINAKFQFGEFSRKALLSLSLSTARYNIWEGSVSSGKTITSIVRWISYIKTAPRGRLLMVGKTERTLKRNVLDDLQAIVGTDNYKKKGDGEIIVYGRVIDLVGANDERAQDKIRGGTYAGAYCDEITLYPESFFQMLITRLRVLGSQLFGTTNPDSPYHWLKENYLNNTKLDLKIFSFTMDDNPNLDPSYVEAMKKAFTGLWYKRFILGLWVMAAGVIYDVFKDDIHKLDSIPSTFDSYYVGMDYGTNNPCVFLLFGKLNNKYYLIKEFYHEGRKEGQKTDSYYATKLKEFVKGYKITKFFLDPSASSFKTELKEQGIYTTDAENSVIDGIRKTSSIIDNNRLFIHTTCKHTLKEFSSYIWDEKAGKKGVDKPIKANDHALDALRYVLYSLESSPPPNVEVIETYGDRKNYDSEFD